MKSICLMVIAATAFADVSYESTSQITGGALVQMANVPMIGSKIKESLKPITSKIAIKGDQMIHRTDQTATIIDLAKENFTTIDFEKKTYSVATFAEMKAAYEKALARINSQVNQKQDVNMNMEFDVKESGKMSTASGFPCKELTVTTKTVATDPQTGRTGEMVMNDLMCVAKDVPGLDEYRKFHAKMAEKMNFDPAAMQSAQGGFFGQSLGQMQKRASMMDGIPVVQYITVSSTTEGLPTTLEAAEAQAKASSEAAPQAKGPSGKDVMGAAAGSVFGGFGRKKPQPSSNPQSTSQAPASMVQMRMAASGFSHGAVDAALFQLPAGFQQVENDFIKRSK